MCTALRHKTIIILILSFCMRSFFTDAMESRTTLATIEQQKKATSTIQNNPYKNTTACVRRGTGISDGEIAYRHAKKEKVCIALEKFLNRSLTGKRIPVIAGVGSGGGYRALFCTQGSCEGLESIKLLDAFTYFTALSGSTWQLAPRITQKMPLKDFGNYIQERCSKPLYDMTPNVMDDIITMLTIKRESGEPIGLVDLYGSLLAHKLLNKLDKKVYEIHLSEQTEQIKNGDIPYPIYIASDARSSVADNPPICVFTPHEIGFLNSDAHIPTWAYGRTFNNGISINNAPEEPLGYTILGTCGSAFGADIKQIMDALQIDKNHPFIQWLEETFFKWIDDDRPLPFYAKVPNYMYQMDDQPLSNEQCLEFVDEGLVNNLPFQPVSGECPERKADIIFLFDASAGHIGEELKKVEDETRRKKIPFPTIDYTDIDKKTISIFKNVHDNNVPVVIYMPRISDAALWEKNKSNHLFKDFDLSGFDLDYETNNGPCGTQYFQYEPALSKKVMNQTMFNMMVNKEIIMREINDVINRL